MSRFFNNFSLAMGCIGACISSWLGGYDIMVKAILVFIVLDYLTGCLFAIATKTLSSEVGFKGIAKKVLILMMIVIAHLADEALFKTGDVLRTATIFFYIANEGISILENAGHLGLPLPKKLKAALIQLRNASEADDVTEDGVGDEWEDPALDDEPDTVKEEK